MNMKSRTEHPIVMAVLLFVFSIVISFAITYLLWWVITLLLGIPFVMNHVFVIYLLKMIFSPINYDMKN